MNIFSTALICAGLACTTGGVSAQEPAKPVDPMHKEGMMKKNMGMQDCRERMVMNKRDGVKQDDASVKADKACADMMKPTDPMKKDAPSEPMKK